MFRHDVLTRALRDPYTETTRKEDEEIADMLDRYRGLVRRLLTELKQYDGMKPRGPKPRGPKPAHYTVDGDSKSLREWAEALGVPLPRLRYLTRNDPVGVLTELAKAKRNPASGR